MADGKIYITITDEPVSSKATSANTSGTQQSGKKDENDNKNSLFGDFVKHQFFNFVESQAKQFMNYSISNIGNFTGNYQSQRQVQETLRIGNMAKGVVLSVAAGAKFGLPGALVAGGIAMASTVINLAYENHSLDVQTKQQNREIAMMRKISGLDALDNGSRWGA